MTENNQQSKTSGKLRGGRFAEQIMTDDLNHVVKSVWASRKMISFLRFMRPPVADIPNTP